MEPVDDSTSDRYFDHPSQMSETDIYVLNNTNFLANTRDEEPITEVFQLFENIEDSTDHLDRYCAIRFK